MPDPSVTGLDAPAWPIEVRWVAARNNLDHLFHGEMPGWTHCDLWLDEERPAGGIRCARCEASAKAARPAPVIYQEDE